MIIRQESFRHIAHTYDIIYEVRYLVISIGHCEEDDGKSSFVVSEQGARISWSLYLDVLPIDGTLKKSTIANLIILNPSL